MVKMEDIKSSALGFFFSQLPNCLFKVCLEVPKKHLAAAPYTLWV
jgi:hypothetical protein